MNERHVCRACGHVCITNDAGAPIICVSCCAASWMIIASEAEFVKTLSSLTLKQSRRIFRAMHVRAAQWAYSKHQE